MEPPEIRVRVALAMLTLVPGGMGGTETYARELTRELASSDRVEARAFVTAAAAGFSAGVPEVIVPEVSSGASAARRLSAVLAARIHRRRILGQMGPPDVLHVPFTVPAPPPVRGVAFVQTLHDVQHLEMPLMFSPAERAFRRATYDWGARHADAVVTISHHAKSAIVQRLGIPAERVFVAHLGVDSGRYRPSGAQRGEVVFYPARGWPHKNHRRLIEAVDLLRRTRPTLRLVLTGGGLERLGSVPDWVEVRGYVSPAEIAELYATAGCLAFPSLYEGFGLPPLEAMAAGCPVAASSAGSIPEVCGDAAVLFDPLDVPDIARGIEAALDSRGALLEKGLSRVRSFTWRACAGVHEEAYVLAARRSADRR